MSSFRKISDIISIDDAGSNEIICVNGQWQFTLPDGLSYGVNEEFSLIEGGIDLSGSVKPLVIKEDWSVYDQAFCAAVAEHYSFTGDHRTITDCKYDNRFSENNGMNSQKVIVDEDDFYVDLISVNTWPLGVEAEIRVRGENITPYNISMMVKPEGDDHWKHIADYFREIAVSVCKSKQTAKTKSTSKKTPQSVSDPNCIMSGTVLQRYIGGDTNVVLPEGITELADNIFSGRSELRSIVIPEGVTKIGNRAFENCFNLQEVVLPESIVEIGRYAFADCHNLESINLDCELESIESSVFSECFKLSNVNIPKSVKYIDAFAFKNCRAFTKIVIPEGVTSVGFTAFAYCLNLEYLYIPTSVTGIYDNFMGQTPFDGCNNLTIYCTQGAYAKEYADEHGINCKYGQLISTGTTKPRKIPKKSDGDDLYTRAPAQSGPTTIAAPAIICTKVKKSDCTIDSEGVLERYNGSDDEIILPSGIEKIGADAFLFKGTLRVVVIPEGVREIGSDAFWGCEALEQVFLPSTLETIGVNAFRSCESLTEIIIPDGVWSIGMDAFEGCKKLKDIYVPFSAVSVEFDAFNTSNNDTVIHTPRLSRAETYAKQHNMRIDQRKAPARAIPRAKKNMSQVKNVVATMGKPEDFEIVEGVLKAYKGQEAHLAIPEGVKEIEMHAFVACAGLETIILPSTLKTIGGLAYRNIKKLQIPNGVETVGKYAFRGCLELRKVTLPPSVRKIEDYAFASCSKKKDVYIPESVTDIACSAFEGSPRIVVHVHPGSYAEEFAKKNKIKYDNEIQIYLDSLNQGKSTNANKKAAESSENQTGAAAINEAVPTDPVPASDFVILGTTLQKYNGKKKNVVVPDGIQIIGEFAFNRRTVASVKLPDSVTEIRDFAFSSCKYLKEINIPKSMVTMGECAFLNCTKLTVVTWPGTAKIIPKEAFSDCESLEEAIIEEGVTEIGRSAFSMCRKLKKVVLPMSLNKIGESVFVLDDDMKLYVYSGSYAETYAKAENIPMVIMYTPEQEAERKRKQEEDERRKKEEEERRRKEEEERRRREEETRVRRAAEEVERRRQREEERRRNREYAERCFREEQERRRREYDALVEKIAKQQQIIRENKGWFGVQARIRKAAQAELHDLQVQLASAFPEGRP